MLVENIEIGKLDDAIKLYKEAVEIASVTKEEMKYLSLIAVGDEAVMEGTRISEVNGKYFSFVKKDTPIDQLGEAVELFFTLNKDNEAFQRQVIVAGQDMSLEPEAIKRQPINIGDLFSHLSNAISLTTQGEATITLFELKADELKRPHVIADSRTFSISHTSHGITSLIKGTVSEDDKALSGGPSHVAVEYITGTRLMPPSVIEELKRAGFAASDLGQLSGGWFSGVEITKTGSGFQNSIFDIRKVGNAFKARTFPKLVSSMESITSSASYSRFSKTEPLDSVSDLRFVGRKFTEVVFNNALSEYSSCKVSLRADVMDTMNTATGSGVGNMVARLGEIGNAAGGVGYTASVKTRKDTGPTELVLYISDTMATAVGSIVIYSHLGESVPFLDPDDYRGWGNRVDDMKSSIARALRDVAREINSSVILDNERARIINMGLHYNNTASVLGMTSPASHIDEQIRAVVTSTASGTEYFSGLKLNPEVLDDAYTSNDYFSISFEETSFVGHMEDSIRFLNSLGDSVDSRRLDSLRSSITDTCRSFNRFSCARSSAQRMARASVKDVAAGLYTSSVCRNLDFGVVVPGGKQGRNLFTPTTEGNFSFITEMPDAIQTGRYNDSLTGLEDTLNKSLNEKTIVNNAKRQARLQRGRLTEQCGAPCGSEEE